MRSMTATLAGRDLTLAVTFVAAQEIAQKAGDPFAIMREAQLEAMLAKVGQVYHPKWNFTVENVPQIIYSGAKAGGEKITLQDVQSLVMDAGILEAREVAIDFITMIATPSAKETLDEVEKDDAPGE